ncbi:IMP dehydrogenase [Candidatus Daviesbacteria bacterium]|nr:IMP dehydrogenase [Candidatus Daviesbacteria bacterium]
MERVNLHPDLQSSEFNLDEICFPPRRIPNFEWSDVDLSTQLTRNIRLRGIPLLSSPMDTVTGSKMAILMALMGGIGVIHYNFPTIEDQMKEVEKVRKFEAGFVKNPAVISPKIKISQVIELINQNGFSSYPVTEDGTLQTKLVGMVTEKDIFDNLELGVSLDSKVNKIMTTAENLVTESRKNTLDKNDIKAANKKIRETHIDTLPIVDKDFKLAALVTRSDLDKNREFELATKDENKQLKVLVAVESRFNNVKERIAQAAYYGATGIVVDSRNIYEDGIPTAKFTKKEFPGLEVVLGNLVTAEVAKDVFERCIVDGLRVGMGGGKVCITAERLGLTRDLGAATRDVAEVRNFYIRKSGYVGLWIDGGVEYPKHFVGGMILGADGAMMGTELAGLEESPGNRILDDRGLLVKTVRGMGSPQAIMERQGASRYGLENVKLRRYPEGIEKKVPYKGDGLDYLNEMLCGIKQAMHGLGCKNIKELRLHGYIAPWHRSPLKS